MGCTHNRERGTSSGIQRHRSGIEGGGGLLVSREDVGCQVEVIVNFVPSVAIISLPLGSRRWYLVRSYVSPNNAPAIHHVEQALEAAQRE